VLALLTPGALCAAPQDCSLTGSELIRWEPAPYPRGSRVLRVGPKREFKTPSEAARVARDGDVVEIDGGTYQDSTLWKQDRLWIRGVNGRPHLQAPEKLVQGKGIWLIRGANVTIENIEFSGAKVPDRNGAGIRAQGPGLTVRASIFHDNENGILVGNDPTSRVVVEFSEFARNGYGDAKSHNLYIGKVDRFEMRFSYSHGAREGQLVKSRARNTILEYNRIIDDVDGTASYEVDLPSGGDALLRGNVIVQSALSPNHAIVSYAHEKQPIVPGRLTLVHNTIYNRRSGGQYVVNKGATPALLINNLFSGSGGPGVSGDYEGSGNLTLPVSSFVDARGDDFRLAARSPAIDSAVGLKGAAVATGAPEFEPVAPLIGQRRRISGDPDIGALEYCRP
jgi:hypothetical protein